jgi:D-serine dehydratase
MKLAAVSLISVLVAVAVVAVVAIRRELETKYRRFIEGREWLRHQNDTH